MSDVLEGDDTVTCNRKDEPMRKHNFISAYFVLGFLVLFCPVSSPTASGQEKEREFTNSIGMKFVLIPAGVFTMGSPLDTYKRRDDETQHQVALSRSFYIQTTEVTQGQWKAVMGRNPSYFWRCGDNCPVDNVSWDDAQDFIRGLNARENTSRYRLPTEAEWEYACRARSQTLFSFGESIEGLDSYGWFHENSENKTHPTGLKLPNAWGLYDMYGNVAEWCKDSYGKYQSGSVTDPDGPTSSASRVLRGSSWNIFKWVINSANRDHIYPACRSRDIGFRLVMDSF
jgi:formylglycine-generating enzyme required for sulfatase activity